MALISQKKGAVTGGVNQQAAEHRLSTQVEEMINCIPTIDRGLVKRNPTKSVGLTNLSGQTVTLNYEDEMWSYEFDRGSSDQSNTEFSFSITSQGLQIVDLNTGIIYTKNNGINYIGLSEQYLHGSFAGRNGYSATTIKDTVFIVNKTISPTLNTSTETVTYDKSAYIWIKRTDNINPYTYSVRIEITDGTTTKIVTANRLGNTDGSEATAANFASTIATKADVTASASGSKIGISALGNYKIVSISTSDTYGNSASFGWSWKVDSTSELPNNMGSYAPLVRVGKNARDSYWLKYNDGSWEESYQQGIDRFINPLTMPHKIYQAVNPSSGKIEFYVSAYSWSLRNVGDNETNKVPQFLLGSPIKDIFFFRNRMGLITNSGVVTSEVGEYGNFFRTTVAALLDSDRIDTAVESRSAVNLEYSLVFDDSVLLFSNESQFRFEGGDILSPSSYKISEITTYAVNLDVRPIPMNNKVYFITRRGEHSAVFEMEISNTSTKSSNAVDITAHCQAYIDQNIDRMTISPVNNMLFLTSKDNRDTVFVYKYYELNGTRHQSAWFKWKFNGDLYVCFALDKKFNLMINRVGLVEGWDWIVGTGEWRNDSKWVSTSPWIMSPDSIDKLKNFEKLDIFPQDHTGIFLDDDTTIISSFVNFGEWVFGEDGNKEVRGNLLFRTIEFSAEEGSTYGLWVQDTNRNTIRKVPYKYIKNRRPKIGANAKHIKTGIIAEEETGFRINSVSFEGSFKSRAKFK